MSQDRPKTVEWQGETWEQVSEGSGTYTNGKDRRNIDRNGNLCLTPGNPGNPGGGRIADKVRLDATKGLENEVARIAGLLQTMVSRAESEFKPDGSLNNGLATMREIGRIANTLTSIGPGTKVTNVVERDGYHDAADRAYTRHDGSKLDFLLKLKEELDAIP